MAQRIVTTIFDDMTGEEGAESISFALDGTNYEIDLTEVNAKSLRMALEPYIDAGRKVANTGSSGSGRKRGRSTAPLSVVRNEPPRPTDPASVRAWAQKQGMEINKRGRISREVMEAYAAAGA